MENEKVFAMSVAKVYPLLIAKRQICGSAPNADAHLQNGSKATTAEINRQI